jgi:hypothetical protein
MTMKRRARIKSQYLGQRDAGEPRYTGDGAGVWCATVEELERAMAEIETVEKKAA